MGRAGRLDRLDNWSIERALVKVVSRDWRCDRPDKMPGTCQAFVENAWKRDLCANCFKSVEEHSPGLARPSLSVQDSLSELEQGTNRYLSVTGSGLAGNSRYRKQIREVVRKNAGNC